MRAAKKAKGGKKAKVQDAPEAWKDAAAASEAKVQRRLRDEAQPIADKVSGMVYENGEAYALVPLDPKTLQVKAGELGRIIALRADVDAQRKKVAKEYRDDIKEMDTRIRELGAEVQLGVRKVPAQQSIPGTEPEAAQS